MSRTVDAILALADEVLAEIPPPLRVRLPEITRDGRRVVRQVSVRKDGTLWLATYGERSGDVGAQFKPVASAVLDDLLACLAWGEGQGHAPTL